MTTTWLIDKSALVRLGSSADADEWADRIGRGLVSITTVTLLEVGFSARSALDLRQASGKPPLSLMPVEYLTPAMEARAVEVQLRLAELTALLAARASAPRGEHRAPGVPDLLIAAAAERAGHTMLHLDKDFELIADITGQPAERLRLA